MDPDPAGTLRHDQVMFEHGEGRERRQIALDLLLLYLERVEESIVRFLNLGPDIVNDTITTLVFHDLALSSSVSIPQT